MGASVPAHQLWMWHDASGGRMCMQAWGLSAAICASAHRPGAARARARLQDQPPRLAICKPSADQIAASPYTSWQRKEKGFRDMCSFSGL